MTTTTLSGRTLMRVKPRSRRELAEQAARKSTTDSAIARGMRWLARQLGQEIDHFKGGQGAFLPLISDTPSAAVNRLFQRLAG